MREGRDRRMSMTARRKLYSAMVGATLIALLCLAVVTVPPRSAGAIAFLALFAVTLPWSVIGFWNACIGFVLLRFCRDPVATVNPPATSVRGDEPIEASTAILVCIRHENPVQVVRNLRPLLDGLAAAQMTSFFHVYILSDSDDPSLATAEEACFSAFVATLRGGIPLTYRRRATNVGFKAGNIREFCLTFGADHDFAIPFDADSFMPAEAVLRIVRIMQADPKLGVVQNLSVGLPSISAFARLFQFGMRLGMHSHTLGAAWWQGDCGPYWGHNAILRLAPFTAYCDIPVLPEDGPLGGHILSHDQIEAALMRRAGFDVRVLPVEGMSWEENPPTVLEHIRRDLRWCHGNMQYWRLLAMPGLKPVSRFQFVFAILMYLGSPAWIALLSLGALTIAVSDAAAASLVQTRPGSALFAIMLSMIFAPKIATFLDALLRGSVRRSYGGAALFLFNFAAEILFSCLLSPVLALSHTIYLFRLFVLRRGGVWNSQNRESHAVAWSLAWSRLWPQTLLGLILLIVTAMKAPEHIGFALLAAGGLALSVPFAVATASPQIGTWFARIGIGRIPEETEPPAGLSSLRLPALEGGGAVAQESPQIL
jgi:membrane glycosyltransferase